MGLLLFTDVETNDKRSKAMEKEPADAEGQPRVASLGYILCDEQSNEVLANYYAMVYPEGWTMGAEAYSVNGLDMDKLRRRGLPILGVIAAFADVMALGEKEPLTLIAHGLQFDYKTLRGELRRQQMPDFYASTRRFCTMTSSVKHVGLKQDGTNRPKWPSLPETYQHYFAKAVTGHHSAFTDAFTVRAIYNEKRKRDEDMTPKEPDGYAIQEPGAPATASAETAASPASPADSGGAQSSPSVVPPEPERPVTPPASPSATIPPTDEDLI